MRQAAHVAMSVRSRRLSGGLQDPWPTFVEPRGSTVANSLQSDRVQSMNVACEQARIRAAAAAAVASQHTQTGQACADIFLPCQTSDKMQGSAVGRLTLSEVEGQKLAACVAALAGEAFAATNSRLMTPRTDSGPLPTAASPRSRASDSVPVAVGASRMPPYQEVGVPVSLVEASMAATTPRNQLDGLPTDSSVGSVPQITGGVGLSSLVLGAHIRRRVSQTRVNRPERTSNPSAPAAPTLRRFESQVVALSAQKRKPMPGDMCRPQERRRPPSTPSKFQK